MPLPLMLLPLLAAGIGVGGRLGLEFMEGDAEAEKAGGFLEALKSARTAVPGSEIGETGPRMPEYTTDWGKVGMSLLEAGDPAGLNIAMRAAMARGESEADARKSELDWRRDMAMEEYKQGEQNKRQMRELEARRRDAEISRAAGMAPVYHSPGSKGHFEIADEGASLKYAASIIRDFQAAMSAHGTESWGELSGNLGAKREQMMLYLKAAEQTGTIDAGTTELFDKMLPDPTRWTGDWFNEEAGRLNALVDLFNSKYITAYQARTRFTSMVPEVGMIPSEELPPVGLDEVTEEDYERGLDEMSELDSEARQRVGAMVDYGEQREAEQALDSLTERAARGELYQRRR